MRSASKRQAAARRKAINRKLGARVFALHASHADRLRATVFLAPRAYDSIRAAYAPQRTRWQEVVEPQQSERIVVVEDNIDVAQAVIRSLATAGYESMHFVRGQELKRYLDKQTPALCIIDLGLPDGDGLDLVRMLQTYRDVAIVILTGRGDATDRVIGLEVGADDYIVKPFEPRELVARVKAVLRRTRLKDTSAALEAVRKARFQNWTYSLDIHSLTSADGKTVTISAAEARLLCVFLNAPKRILSREQLLEATSSEEISAFDRAIDVRVSRLRRKIEANSEDPQIIKTVYGAGYLFTASVEWIESAQ